MSNHTDRQRRELLQGVGNILSQCADDPNTLQAVIDNWEPALTPTLIFIAVNERQMNRKLAEHINDLEQGV
ncbi:hypothetical protein PQI66_04390 [Corynebacterium sp. USCH3]|uniref:hypothetical protein n=1 Tax=Corynebacterium sp. USCH3 TaxID=3024840 RepID=UPI0030A11B2A